MSLPLRPLFERACREFSKVPVDEWGGPFVNYVNDALDDLSAYAAMSTAIAHVDDPDDTISELDAEHAFILMSGVRYYALLGGEKSIGGDAAFAAARDDWLEDKRPRWMTIKRREDAESTDDNDIPETDLIALGNTEED